MTKYALGKVKVSKNHTSRQASKMESNKETG